MQNLEAYQKLELDKQLGKIQITNAFQNYLKKTLSICLSQQTILQNAGINPAHFFGVLPNGRPNLLQPDYFDPATIFGPSTTLLNSMIPQMDGRAPTQQPNNPIPQINSQSTGATTLPQFNSITSNPTNQQNAPSFFSNRISELGKFDSIDKDGLLSEFLDKRNSSEGSMRFPHLLREEDANDTGKKCSMNETLTNMNSLDPNVKQKTKVVCGHPEKPHHAKVATSFRKIELNSQ